MNNKVVIRRLLQLKLSTLFKKVLSQEKYTAINVVKNTHTDRYTKM